MDTLTLILVLAVTLLAFVVSASAGLGGSLLLVPVLALVIGAKEGIALAALLLGGNNIFKTIAYRKHLPFAAASIVILLLSAGALLGASALVAVPAEYVAIGILASFSLTLVAERRGWRMSQRLGAPVMAFAAGATSGFSGTSGPLKGAALRNLPLDRHHLVGGASLASLFGDLTKTAVFADAALLTADSVRILILAAPLMVAGTWLGRRLNRRMSEAGYALLFWGVMAGYSVRVATTLL